MQTIVRERRADGELGARSDLLALFMRDVPLSGATFVGTFGVIARATDLSQDDKALQDVVMSFLLAGRDTTASSLTFTFLNLVKHPEVCDRVVTEVYTLL